VVFHCARGGLARNWGWWDGCVVFHCERWISEELSRRMDIEVSSVVVKGGTCILDLYSVWTNIRFMFSLLNNSILSIWSNFTVNSSMFRCTNSGVVNSKNKWSMGHIAHVGHLGPYSKIFIIYAFDFFCEFNLPLW
jgi:hypothetical protein